MATVGRIPRQTILSVLLVLGAISAAPAKSALAAGGEKDDFFIVSSVDFLKKSIVVKRPTEVTLTIRVTERTRYRSESGKTIALSDLKAGDTVFIAADRDAAGQLVASSIREGVMTVPELQKRYLRPGR
jgi:hypothetical protein